MFSCLAMNPPAAVYSAAPIVAPAPMAAAPSSAMLVERMGWDGIGRSISSTAVLSNVDRREGS